jgi:hypothetical protein
MVAIPFRSLLRQQTSTLLPLSAQYRCGTSVAARLPKDGLQLDGRHFADRCRTVVSHRVNAGAVAAGNALSLYSIIPCLPVLNDCVPFNRLIVQHVQFTERIAPPLESIYTSRELDLLRVKGLLLFRLFPQSERTTCFRLVLN